MKTKAIVATVGFFLMSQEVALACMSDKACESASEVSMCCYMNECVPSSNIGCRASRLDFYRHLQSHDTECQMKEFADELRRKSAKVRQCDDRGTSCIDYVTELMRDPGVFETLDNVVGEEDTESMFIGIRDIITGKIGNYLM